MHSTLRAAAGRSHRELRVRCVLLESFLDLAGAGGLPVMYNHFDPYRDWLGITDEQRPPGMYVLLGLEPFETDQDRIEQAILRRTFAVSDQLTGPERDWAEKLLNQLQQAESWLMNASRKAEYDAFLRDSLSPSAGSKQNTQPNAAVEDVDDAPVMLIEVDAPAEAPIMLVEIAPQPLDEAAVLLEVAESPAAKAVPAIHDVSAAEIAEKILRDDVKPQFVPQRVSDVKRLPQRAPKPVEESKPHVLPDPPRPRERFDSLKPMPKSPAPTPAAKLSADAKTLVSQPLLSRVDVIAATNRQLPKYDPSSQKQTLDLSVLLDTSRMLLNRYSKSISPSKLIAATLAATAVVLAFRYGPQMIALIPSNPDKVMAMIEDSDPHTRSNGIERLPNLKMPPAEMGTLLLGILKRDSSAAVRLKAVDALVNTGAINSEVSEELTGLLETEQDEQIKARLKWFIEPNRGR